jgi:Zn-dependent M28 family amino/carboxypeptidase
MRIWLTVALTVSVAVPPVGLAACDRQPEQPTQPSEYAAQVSSSVTIDAMVKHLQKLQDIADANGGTRVTGSPGFDASVKFVADTLRDKGFDVTTPEFEMDVFTVDRAALTVRGAPVEAHAVDYTQASPKDGVTGPLVVAPSGDAPGCAATDYAGLPVKGAVVVVDRGACYLIEKAQAAAEAGAAAVIIANNADEKSFSGGMSAGDDSKIPVLSVSKSVGSQLKSQPGDATVLIDSSIDKVKTHNVIAQTKTGDTDDVVVVGGHLDSVRAGPGINDNGSGVAAILETALQMGNSPSISHAVRFAFWSGEEEGLFGSLDYVRSLGEEGLKDVALYLNFDMLGSPNPCYFTSDADQSMPPDFEAGLQPIPEGSPGIERALVAALESNGVTPEDMAFDGRSDYDSFTRAGIPSGNMDTGADELKSAQQVAEWSGQEGKACDPNYHSPDDTIANVNRDALSKTGRVVGYVTALYAQDQTGRNGIPVREDRTRHVPPVE